jgi:hypothetical protein
MLNYCFKNTAFNASNKYAMVTTATMKKLLALNEK